MKTKDGISDPIGKTSAPTNYGDLKSDMEIDEVILKYF